MIHGLRNGFGWLGTWHLAFDWTRGCIALTDGEMMWLYRAVPDGTPVVIRA
jgi:lipoprotein-anchoring transpeptidase ErfK/SrfK